MTPASPPTASEIILAYRNLYRHLLHAVQYSKPARFVARDRLRKVFRSPQNLQDYDAAKIARMLEFLKGAAVTNGIEHRVVRNWMHVWWERGKGRHAQQKISPFQDVAYEQFDRTVEALNETMGLCIK